jgi:uncharacterized membrane protein YkvA (DUF1232 family)
MNANKFKSQLPLVWYEMELSTPHRRKNIGNVSVSDYAVEVLNDSISKIDDSYSSLSADQITSCGRQLLSSQVFSAQLPASCILERFKTVGYLDRMVKDGDWDIEDLAAYKIDVLLDYVKLHEELIPHNAPMIGHLDDAILVEASWRSLREEIESYADYRRLRKLEADLQGKDLHEFRYNRQNWLESREAELALIRNQREQGLSSFCSNVEVRLFHVH